MCARLRLNRRIEPQNPAHTPAPTVSILKNGKPVIQAHASATVKIDRRFYTAWTLSGY